MENYHYQQQPMTSSPSTWAVAADQNSSSSSTVLHFAKRGSSSSGMKRRPAAAAAAAAGDATGAVKLSTDPQSVAARQRRHRISDRFRVLKSLVPGGSKMDTVSMLEEAINYVKFLKAQIWLHQAAIINPNFDQCCPHQDLLLPFDPANLLLPPPPPPPPPAAAADDDGVLGCSVYASTAASSSPVLPPFPYCSFQGEDQM